MATMTVPLAVQNLVLSIIRERDGQLLALAQSIERMLGESCNEGDNPPDVAPLCEWRLAQVMKGLLESDDAEYSIAGLLGGEPDELNLVPIADKLPRVPRWVEDVGGATLFLEYRPEEGCAIVDMRGVVTAKTLAHVHRRIVAHLEGYPVFGRVELLDRCVLFLTEDELDSLLPGDLGNFLSGPAAIVGQSGMEKMLLNHTWTAANNGFIRNAVWARDEAIVWALDTASFRKKIAGHLRSSSEPSHG